MTYARSILVPPSSPGTYHCVSRCVRRAWLCGEDRESGRSYEHRRQWVEDRIRKLADIFAVAVWGYAVMSNHLHVVVQIVPQAAAQWSADDVAARWLRLYSRQDQDVGKRAEARTTRDSRVSDFSDTREACFRTALKGRRADAGSMTYARSILVPPSSPGTYHCVSRCVRRAWLCGEDRESGCSYEHRRQWVEDRIRELADIFAVAVWGYAVMSNHLHVVVQIVPQAAAQWSADDVAARWQQQHRTPMNQNLPNAGAG